MSSNDQQEFLLSPKEIERIHHLVRTFLAPDIDREYIADTIILTAWSRGRSTMSRAYVRNKCISAWRTIQRERRRNENFLRQQQASSESIEDTSSILGKKDLIQETVKICLTPTERKLVWMRYYNSQSLKEMISNSGMNRDEIQKTLKVALYKMRIELT